LGEDVAKSTDEVEDGWIEPENGREEEPTG